MWAVWTRLRSDFVEDEERSSSIWRQARVLLVKLFLSFLWPDGKVLEEAKVYLK